MSYELIREEVEVEFLRHLGNVKPDNTDEAYKALWKLSTYAYIGLLAVYMGIMCWVYILIDVVLGHVACAITFAIVSLIALHFSWSLFYMSKDAIDNTVDEYFGG